MKMQLNIIKNKRSQIGETLTWVVALFIILFIMALFALATLEIAKLKGVQPAGTLATDKMQFSYSEAAIVQEKFIGFINMNLGGGNTIYKLLVNSEKFDVGQAYLHGLTAGQNTFHQKGTEFIQSLFPATDFEAGFFFQEAKKLLSVPSGKFPIDWDVVGNAGYSISGYPTPLLIDYPLWRIPIYPNKRLTLISVKKTAGAEVK